MAETGRNATVSAAATTAPKIGVMEACETGEGEAVTKEATQKSDVADEELISVAITTMAEVATTKVMAKVAISLPTKAAEMVSVVPKIEPTKSTTCSHRAHVCRERPDVAAESKQGSTRLHEETELGFAKRTKETIMEPKTTGKRCASVEANMADEISGIAGLPEAAGSTASPVA